MLGIVHLMAFGSFATQILGLNGSHGVLPTSEFLNAMGEQLGAGPERFYLLPTLAWLNSSDAFIQGMANCGVILSIMVILGIFTGPALVLCMVLWLSLITGGGEFTQFQSDGMLVEATLLSLFVVPWTIFEPPWPVPISWRRQFAPSLVGIWLVRLMIFRFMFASGLVKILSHDPTWANLTALQYHFETQPLPTPLAWYADHLPKWVLSGMVLGMYVSELIAPCLVFGTSIMRYIGAMLICALQLGIIVTGNYTFLNYLTMVLAVSMLDDGFFEKTLPAKLKEKIEQSVVACSGRLATLRRRFLYFLSAPMYILAAGAFLTSFMPSRGVIEGLMELVSPLHIADRYGVFAVMTTERPEIIFEGSNDGKSWMPYELQNKPDNPNRAPPWVAPHMPRLSWRLWFAGMGPPAASPWVLPLIEKMLTNSPSVVSFFEHNPFPNQPPKYIRALVYDYHFTDDQQRRKSGAWWRRDNQRTWLPPLMMRDGTLQSAPLPAADDNPVIR
jgi:hypothetical protein